MRRVPDADLLNGTLAFLLQVRDAAELHGRVTSYNFSHFTYFGLAGPSCPFSPKTKLRSSAKRSSFERDSNRSFPNSCVLLSSFQACSVATVFNLGSGTPPNFSRLCIIYPSNQRRLTTPPNKLRLSWNPYARLAYPFKTVDSYMGLLEGKNLL